MLKLWNNAPSADSRWLAQAPVYYLGVDIGQKRDHAALVLLERLERSTNRRDPVTFNWIIEVRRTLRFAAALPLGISFDEIVSTVRAVAMRAELNNRCFVAIDATGVGAPVAETLKRQRIAKEVTPITITGGEKARQEDGGWRVPKRELIQNLVILLEQGELHIPAKSNGMQQLMKELERMQARTRDTGSESYEGRGAHDDLVMALALACWRGREKNIGTPLPSDRATY